MTVPEFVDVSDNNGLDINWNEVWASGVRGAICKVVQGDGSIHPGFLNNWASCGLALLAGKAERRGAYNFCEGHDSPKADADKAYNLVQMGGGFTHPDDFLVMDCETAGITADWAYAALTEASMKLGRPAWCYCAYGWLVGNFHSDKRLAQFPLWVADINATLPRLPWEHALWQYTWRASVPGIHSLVDGSRRGPQYINTLSGNAVVPGTPGSEEEQEMIVQPNKPSKVKGRVCTAKLNIAGGTVDLYNGAAIAYDQPTADPLLRRWRIGAHEGDGNPKLNGVPLGVAPLPDGSGVVVTMSDKGTFVGKWS